MKELFENWNTIGGASIISALIAYLSARRKNNLEADSKELDIKVKTIEVYRKIIDDLQEQIERLKNEVDELRYDFEERLKKCYENK